MNRREYEIRMRRSFDFGIRRGFSRSSPKLDLHLMAHKSTTELSSLLLPRSYLYFRVI